MRTCETEMTSSTCVNAIISGDRADHCISRLQPWFYTVAAQFHNMGLEEIRKQGHREREQCDVLYTG